MPISAFHSVVKVKITPEEKQLYTEFTNLVSWWFIDRNDPIPKDI